jgi:molybdenum-dependent DNA-binding transcriptional regulator ModE
MERCAEQERLRAEVHEILREIDKLNEQSIEALNTWDDQRLLVLDKQLEQLTGKKERAYGALFQHRSDHGC